MCTENPALTTMGQNSLSSPQPDWLLSYHRDALQMATITLLDTEYPDRNKDWQTILSLVGCSSDEMYQACCKLLAEGFDPDKWWRLHADPIEDDEPQPQTPTAAQVEHRSFSDTEIIELVLRHIVNNRIDITADRIQWLTIGSVLKSNFPEDAARQWYLAVSQFYPGFTERETLSTFRSLRSRGFTGAPLYSICARYNISVKEIVLRARNRF